MTFKQSVCFPSFEGSLFLPEMLEFNAKHNPTRPIYTFYDADMGDLRHISHLEFYRASQRIAHAVRPDRQGPDNDVVGIIANCDTILYQALTMGIMFAGLVPFPMSPRNSLAAVLNMMRRTGCHRLIATRHLLTPLLDDLDRELPELRVEEAPALAYAYPELGNETTTSPFVPYRKSEIRPLKDNVLFYLHSSGSTGFPKPIPITNITAVHWCMMPFAHDLMNFPRHITLCAASAPSFHMLGLLLQIFFPIATLQTIAVFPPMSYDDATKAPVIPNSQNIIEVVQLTKSEVLSIVPTFLEEWVNWSHAIEVLRSLESVNFAGGPLSKKTGDKLVAAGVKIVCSYGGTEFGPLTYTFRNSIERPLWEWLRFGPNQTFRWMPLGDGTYECQLLSSPTHQLSIENLPDVKGYATSDVFIKHPTIEGLYKIVGRIDDVLIHSSGEKTVPAPMEAVIGASPMLSGVCMFGRGRNQTGVLVEPRPEYAIDVTNDRQVAEFRDSLWREVEEANLEAPAFSRIFKEMILVTSKEKPMQRTGKGTVTKKGTMKLYEPEIDALYASMEANAKAGIDVSLPSTWSQPEVEDWLMVHATAVNGGTPIEVDEDLFEQGFDSLSSTFLKNRIISSLDASSHENLRVAACRVAQNVVFSNPTLELLAEHLIQVVAAKQAPRPSALDPKAEVEAIIAKYANGLDVNLNDGSGAVSHHRHVALLTGSTGGLGSYLLASLLSREDVAVVYAFNRPSKTATIRQRQRAGFEDRGLDTNLLDSEKLVYIEGDATQANLALDDGTYDKIRKSVTVIIHNAWRLDFNLGLSSFEPHVRGTRHLIDLARMSNGSRLMFTSSISSAQGWDKRKGPFAEEIQSDAGVAVGLGYGASKYVSERILAMSGLRATSFRIGQISGGAPRGAWSTSDWIPIIVKSSVTLGALPEGLGAASWLPPQAVSNAILDIAFTEEEPPLAVNLVHPRPIAWTSIMQSVSEALHQKHLTPYPLPLIPFTEWVERLAKHAAGMGSEEGIRRLPAVKLDGFVRALAQEDAVLRREQSNATDDVEFAGSPSFATDIAQRMSETMRDLMPLSPVDAVRWVDYWESVGMFGPGV